jgi:hypothetical protein
MICTCALTRASAGLSPRRAGGPMTTNRALSRGRSFTPRSGPSDAQVGSRVRRLRCGTGQGLQEAGCPQAGHRLLGPRPTWAGSGPHTSASLQGGPAVSANVQGSDRNHPSIREARTKALAITVPETLTALHPVIRQILQEMRRQPDEKGMLALPVPMLTLALRCARCVWLDEGTGGGPSKAGSSDPPRRNTTRRLISVCITDPILRELQERQGAALLGQYVRLSRNETLLTESVGAGYRSSERGLPQFLRTPAARPRLVVPSSIQGRPDQPCSLGTAMRGPRRLGPSLSTRSCPSPGVRLACLRV